MRNSESKRFFRTVALFLAVILVVSLALSQIYLQGENFYFQDVRERDELAGSVTYLICGASYVMYGIKPDIVDQYLGVKSYDLCSGLLTMQGRYTLLAQELARNPVHTVVLEVSCDTLLRRRAEDGPEGDLAMLGKLHGLKERLPYFLQAFPLKEWPAVYYDYVSKGILAAERLPFGTYTTRNKNLSRGYYGEHNQPPPMPTDFRGLYKIYAHPEEIPQENVDGLERLIKLCRDNGANVLLITMPQSKIYNCMYRNMDFFQTWFNDFAARHGITYYNFNLYNRKLELLPDDTAFYDETHLNDYGAEEFSKLFGRLMADRAAGKDIDWQFYKTYADLDYFSDYWNS